MWAFIEHHALRSSGHCCISYLGSRGEPALDQGLKYLRSPDNGHMGRLANPEYLLLNLRHSLETNLDPEIASSHHHGGYRSAHRRKQNPGKSFNCGTILDFEDDSSLPRSKTLELSNQFRHIFGTTHKRERDQISIFGRKFEVFPVLRREGRNAEFGIGQVNALLCTKLGGAIGSMGDFYFDSRVRAFFVDRTNDTFNLAVVEENALTGLCIREDSRK